MTGELLNTSHDQDGSDEREHVTRDVGRELNSLFNRHADFATVDEDGTRRLSLRVQLSASFAPAHITSKVDENGVRTAYMWLQPGKALGSEMFKYTDGVDMTPSLEPYKFDAETGETVSRTVGSGRYDPNTDKEVAFWGGLWLKNLRECPPIGPKSTRLPRFLSRFAMKGARG